jgi:hypothetical protein
MEIWTTPQEQPPDPGDHIKVILEGGDIVTGLARDFTEPFLVYHLIQKDPFYGRQNAEQPEVPRPPPAPTPSPTPSPTPAPAPVPAPAAGRKRYKVKKTATSILSLDSESWVETYRWRWLAAMEVWLCKVPHSTTVYIHAELIDD